ncbi:MAG: purine-nucleoside phosphorylase [Coraliomargarita sp.]
MKLPKLPLELIDFRPQVGLVLGSGLGFFADERIDVAGRVPYEQIDGFPVSTVAGHAGRFVYGTIHGVRVLCMQGRFHHYEGYRLQELTMPIRLMKQVGIETVVLTNAAGGINSDFAPGDFMLLTDHINFLGNNPLIGSQPSADEARFPDMTTVYDATLREQILASAKQQSIELKQGVYLATTGPSFETPAEIRAFAALGADAVGMSTVPEAIVARQIGLRVIGISCITNAAAGMSDGPLTHEEVSETADRVRLEFADLLETSIRLSN